MVSEDWYSVFSIIYMLLKMKYIKTSYHSHLFKCSTNLIIIFADLICIKSRLLNWVIQRTTQDYTYNICWNHFYRTLQQLKQYQMFSLSYKNSGFWSFLSNIFIIPKCSYQFCSLLLGFWQNQFVYSQNS